MAEPAFIAYTNEDFHEKALFQFVQELQLGWYRTATADSEPPRSAGAKLAKHEWKLFG
jgi:hypothetical protein